MRTSIWGLAVAMLVAIAMSLGAQTPANGSISGVVQSAAGPEAGVWVIAETKDLATNYIKIVVTDDRGRFVVPDLPAASYRVWVRGYGLVDSTPTALKPAAASVTLGGGFRDVTFGNVLAGSIFTLAGDAHDVTFGNVAGGATVSLGTTASSGSIHDFTGGDIQGNLSVYDASHDGTVGLISGHVFLQNVGHQFTTASKKAGNWVNNDLHLLDAPLQHECGITGKARRCRRATPGRGEQREHKDGREG